MSPEYNKEFQPGWYFTVGVAFAHNSQKPDRVMPFLVGPFLTEEEAAMEYSSRKYSDAPPGTTDEFIRVSPPSYHWVDLSPIMMTFERFHGLRQIARGLVVQLDRVRARLERLVA